MTRHFWRQDLHPEPPRGWLNDPNGLAWFGGSYHVFFQYCPGAADGSGPKCWGHWESPDLVHWTFTGAPLQPGGPHDKGDAYSGSAIEEKGLLWLYYTGNYKAPGPYDYIHAGREHNTLRVAFDGRACVGEKQLLLSNADYPADCTLHVRDPKVWRGADGVWRMVLGARSLRDTGRVLLYHSPDGARWTLNRVLEKPGFGYMWECPDCFELDGRWYLSASPQGLPHGETRFQNVYQSGYFALDGAPETGELQDFFEWDMGFDFYAPQTFLAPDGRRLLLAWMAMPDAEYQNPTAALGWQHCLTLPREVWADGAGRLCQRPARELDALCGDFGALPAALNGPARLQGRAGQDGELCVGGLRLRFAPDAGMFVMDFTDGSGAGRGVRRAPVDKGPLDFDLWVDRSGAEIYLNGGRTVLSTRFYPPEGPLPLTARGLRAQYAPLRPMEVTERAPLF